MEHENGKSGVTIQFINLELRTILIDFYCLYLYYYHLLNHGSLLERPYV